MYELTVSSRKQLERASLRAQAQKPRIEEIALGMYKVWSTNPNNPYTFYSTGIFPAKDGSGYDVVCSCPTQRTVCKHAAAIFPHYLMRVQQFNEADIEIPGITSVIHEIRNTCKATEKVLAEYTAAQGVVVQGVITTSTQEIENLIEQAKEDSFEQDHEDLFGFAPVRRERVKEEW